MLTIRIQNDGTGTEARGNYDVTVDVNGEVIARAKVRDFIRKLGWHRLARVGVDFAAFGAHREEKRA